MATPSRILAWEIPGTEEPGRLWSVRLQSRTRLNDLTPPPVLSKMRPLRLPVVPTAWDGAAVVCTPHCFAQIPGRCG